MQYFVTGATGFIGKRLVKILLARRDATVYFLLRPGAEAKVPELLSYWGVSKARAIPVLGDLDVQEAGRRRRPDQGAQGPDRPLLPPGRRLRPGR